MNVRSVATTGVVIAAALAGGQFFGLLGQGVMAPKKPPPEAALADELARAAQATNARTPTLFSGGTRLERAVAGPGARLTYFYTLPHKTAAHVDAGFPARVRADVVQGTCEQLYRSLELGATYVYVYATQDGQEFVRAAVQRADCPAK